MNTNFLNEETSAYLKSKKVCNVKKISNCFSCKNKCDLVKAICNYKFPNDFEDIDNEVLLKLFVKYQEDIKQNPQIIKIIIESLVKYKETIPFDEMTIDEFTIKDFKYMQGNLPIRHSGCERCSKEAIISINNYNSRCYGCEKYNFLSVNIRPLQWIKENYPRSYKRIFSKIDLSEMSKNSLRLLENNSDSYYYVNSNRKHNEMFIKLWDIIDDLPTEYEDDEDDKDLITNYERKIIKKN